MTLTEFLLARIAEDEVTAREAIDHPDEDCFDSPHQARWWPPRVLAECAAKRQIIALHRLADGAMYRETECCARCTASGEYPADDGYTDEQNWPCPTLRALALPYADHPDYDEARRP